MADWGICTTVKAPIEQVLAFVAWHLDMGAARIWLFFDDPDDPAADAVSGLPRVVATRCTEAHWRSFGPRRPEKHQVRQSRNMQRLYVHCGLPWLAHVDVDEFLLPDRPIAEVLDTVPLGQPLLAIAPWEALHDATLADDIFTARHFRTAFKPSWLEGLHELVFTPFHVMLPQGVLSHCNGKCFFRIGVPRLQPRIHGAFRDKVRMIPGPFCPDIALLHFHAQDAVRWRDNLQFRLTRGAYMFNPELQAFLTAATDAQIDDFYRKVQVSDPETIAGLEELGLVRTAELGLRARVERLLAERHAPLHSSVE